MWDFVRIPNKNLGMSTYEKRDDGHLLRSQDFTPISYMEVLPNQGHRHSLKYFLDNRLPSLEKHRWVTKMRRYDYEIIYNKGNEASSLLQKYEEKGSLFALSLQFLIASSTLVKNGSILTWRFNSPKCFRRIPIPLRATHGNAIPWSIKRAFFWFKIVL